MSFPAIYTKLGENSYGKGSVQSIIPLKNNGAIRLTVSKYYLPSGKSISDVGVTPDIEIDESSDEFKRASSKKQKQMEEDKIKEFAAARKRLAIMENAASFAQASINIAEAITAAAPNVPLQIAVGVMGAAQLAAITATPLPEFKYGGMVGGRRHSQGGTMIEAEQGEFVMSRNAVDAIGIENLNRMNQGGGAPVNVTVTGNVMTQDFVEGELAEAIRKASSRGTDFGVS